MITYKQAKRNYLRFLGFDLPNSILDKVKKGDLKIDQTYEPMKLILKAHFKVNTKDWRIVRGSLATQTK